LSADCLTNFGGLLDIYKNIAKCFYIFFIYFLRLRRRLRLVLREERLLTRLVRLAVFLFFEVRRLRRRRPPTKAAFDAQFVIII
tara:strand:+ start:1307 stop:1558 length:252 start_codon:yes stop_codon:yes gene_type:complete